MDKNLIGIFETEESTIRAIKRLKTSGYADDEISVLAKKKDKLDRIEDETDVDVEKEHADGAVGGVGGAVAGGVLGGAGALLLELGVFSIPGVGPLLAAGPIAVTLGGIIAGGAVGGVVGALIDLGFSEEDAEEYKNYLDQGNILVLVEERDNKDAVYENFYQNESLNRDGYENRDRYEEMNRERYGEDLERERNEYSE